MKLTYTLGGWEPSFTQIGSVNGCNQLGEAVCKLKIYTDDLLFLSYVYVFVYQRTKETFIRTSLVITPN